MDGYVNLNSDRDWEDQSEDKGLYGLVGRLQAGFNSLFGRSRHALDFIEWRVGTVQRTEDPSDPYDKRYHDYDIVVCFRVVTPPESDYRFIDVSGTVAAHVSNTGRFYYKPVGVGYRPGLCSTEGFVATIGSNSSSEKTTFSYSTAGNRQWGVEDQTLAPLAEFVFQEFLHKSLEEAVTFDVTSDHEARLVNG